MIRALATITTTLAALGGCGATDPCPWAGADQLVSSGVAD